MKTETKFFFASEPANSVRFHSRAHRTYIEEPHLVTAWATIPGQGTVILELDPDQAEQMASKMLQAVREARNLDREKGINA